MFFSAEFYMVLILRHILLDKLMIFQRRNKLEDLEIKREKYFREERCIIGFFIGYTIIQVISQLIFLIYSL